MLTILQQPLFFLVVLLFASFLVSLAFHPTSTELIRRFALSSSLFALIVGVVSCLSFNQSAGFQFLCRLDILPQYNLSLSLGADGISMVFLLLTLFVFPICFLAA